MNTISYQSPPPPRWFPFLPPDPPRSNAFWETRNICNQLKELQATLTLAQAMYGCTICTGLFLFYGNLSVLFYKLVLIKL